MKNQYRQLTYTQRCPITALKNTGHTQRDIAIVIGSSQPTISRELTRNTGLRGYRHKQAQTRAIQRREDAHRAIRITHDIIIAYICRANAHRAIKMTDNIILEPMRRSNWAGPLTDIRGADSQ
jgi:IS30 family transposase